MQHGRQLYINKWTVTLLETALFTAKLEYYSREYYLRAVDTMGQATKLGWDRPW